jgi:hypothetical protein
MSWHQAKSQVGRRLERCDRLRSIQTIGQPMLLFLDDNDAAARGCGLKSGHLSVTSLALYVVSFKPAMRARLLVLDLWNVLDRDGYGPWLPQWETLRFEIIWAFASFRHLLRPSDAYRIDLVLPSEQKNRRTVLRAVRMLPAWGYGRSRAACCPRLRGSHCPKCFCMRQSGGIRNTTSPHPHTKMRVSWKCRCV